MFENKKEPARSAEADPRAQLGTDGHMRRPGTYARYPMGASHVTRLSTNDFRPRVDARAVQFRWL